MKFLKSGTAAAVLALGVYAGPAHAASVTIDINADWDTSTTGLISSSVIDWGAPGIVSINSITVELSHSSAGDLEMNLAGPAGISLILSIPMIVGNDVGVAGTGTLGDVAAYTFVPSGGAVWPDDAALGGGTYNAFSWAAGPFADPNGWVFNVFDQFGGNGGAVGSVTIDFTPVPLPAALWFMMGGLAALTGLRRK